MENSLLIGIFIIIGVLLGGLISFLLMIYKEKINHINNIQKVKEEIIIKKLCSINGVIKHLPKNNDELDQYKEYYINVYCKENNEKEKILAMIYLTDDFTRQFDLIERYINDIKIDCDFRDIKRNLNYYRNVLINISKCELKIIYSPSSIQKRHERLKKYMDKEIPYLFEDAFKEVEEEGQGMKG